MRNAFGEWINHSIDYIDNDLKALRDQLDKDRDERDEREAIEKCEKEKESIREQLRSLGITPCA